MPICIIIQIKHKKLIYYVFIHSVRILHSIVIMSAQATTSAIETVAPETVSVAVDTGRSPDYWPLTLDAVRDCDLSYMNDDWSEDMIRDAMRAIIRVGTLPEISCKEINVWQYLSKYSPPEDRGFMFGIGDDRIVTLVINHMEIGHSGCSMAWTMRNIEFIAKNGIMKHREKF